MSLLRWLHSWIRYLRHRERLDQELGDELRAYADLVADEHRARGVADADAARRGRLALGGLEPTAAAVRAGRPCAFASVLAGEIRHTIRRLVRTPVFATAAILVLGLGIGMGTALLAVLNFLLFAPATFVQPSEPQTLVRFVGSGSRASAQIAADVLEQMLARSPESLAAVSTVGTSRLAVSVGGSARLAAVATVGGAYFDVLGAKPLLGRLLNPADAESDSSGIVLSERAWRSWLGADPDAIGRPVVVGGRSGRLVGVVAEPFRGFVSGVSVADVWVGGRTGGIAFARLRPGSTVDDADAEVSTHYFEQGPGDTLRPLGIASGLFAPIDLRAYAFLAVAIGIAALIAAAAAANVTLLLVARASTRGGELATRLALGASGRDLGRLLAIEAGLLASGAAGVSVWVATALGHVASRQLVDAIGLTGAAVGIQVDWRIYAYVALAAFTVTWIAARALAAHVSSAEAVAALCATAGTGGATWRSAPTRRRLVAFQVGCSTAFLVLAGLWTSAAFSTLAASPGFDPEGAIVAWIDHAAQGHDDATVHSIHRTLLSTARETPGAQEAALATALPGAEAARMRIVAGDDAIEHPAYIIGTTPAFFDVIRLRLIRGRTFTDDEVERNEPLAVVSESTAQALWPDSEAIGQTLQIRYRDILTPPVVVVGVVADANANPGGRGIPRAVYLPLEVVVPEWYFPFKWRSALLVRGNAPEAILLNAVRETVATSHTNLAFESARSLRDEMDNPFAGQTLAAKAFGVAGVGTLIMVLTGLYGVTASLAEQRRREFAVKRVLGASVSRLCRDSLAETTVTAVRGIGPGLILALALGAVFHGRWVQMNADLLVILGVPLLLLAASITATLIPLARVLHERAGDALRSGG